MLGKQKGVITFVLGTRTHFGAKMLEKIRVAVLAFWAKTLVCMGVEDTDTDKN